MKKQWMPWMLGGVLVTVFTFPVLAQSPSLTQLFPALVGLSLTPTQTAQLEHLSQQTLPQIQALLTPNQQVQFNQALAQGNSVRAAARLVNLSARQRLQLLKLLQTTRSQVATLLTPEQQQQIQKNAKALQP